MLSTDKRPLEFGSSGIEAVVRDATDGGCLPLFAALGLDAVSVTVVAYLLEALYLGHPPE